jgi:hypothetical protein
MRQRSILRIGSAVLEKQCQAADRDSAGVATLRNLHTELFE